MLRRTSENSSSRDCLESNWKGCIAPLLLARAVEKETFTLVPQALLTTERSLSGLSRQSLEGAFSEVRLPLYAVLGSSPERLRRRSTRGSLPRLDCHPSSRKRSQPRSRHPIAIAQLRLSAKPQLGVRHRLFAGPREEVVDLVAHQIAVDFWVLEPHLDRPGYLVIDPAAGYLRCPRGLRPSERIAAFESQTSTRTQRLTDGRERRGPNLVVPDDLGHVAGHDRKIGSDFSQAKRVPFDPSQPLAASPAPSLSSIAFEGSTPVSRWPRLANSQVSSPVPHPTS